MHPINYIAPQKPFFKNPRIRWALLTLFPFFLFVLTLSVFAETNGGNWALPDRDYRMTVSVAADGTMRVDKVAELDIDFAARLTNDGALGSFDEESLRVVEVDGSGLAIDTTVPFQFDNGSVADTADGTLVFLLTGTTLSNTTRTYHIYYDTTGTFTQPSPFTDRVDRQSDQTYRGQSSFVIISRDANGTANSTYYYHKEGAGFASILDRDNNDWISYYPESYSRSGGEYRGIPNLGYVFHPGYSDLSGSDQGSDTAVLEDGPLKLTIHAQSYDDSVEAIWEIYPTYAQMTLLDYPNNDQYWMLYEGTPGGNLEYTGANKDYMMTSANTQVFVDDNVNMELSPEWVYFADSTIDRSLYLIHSNDDAQPDSYRYQDDGSPATGSSDNGAMTVFGYGRHTGTGVDRYLTATNIHLTIGFTENRAFNGASSTINNVSQPLLITVDPGSPEVDINNGLQLDQGTTAVISNTQLLASDPDDDPITYTVKTTPTHGTLLRNASPLVLNSTFTQNDIDTGLLSYTHDDSNNLSDEFTFTVTDGIYTSAQATFLITITAVSNPQNAPTLDLNNGLQLDEGATAVISNTQLLATDLDGDTITYALKTTSAHGTLSRNTSPLSTEDTFTQDDIDAGFISYAHDGSENHNDTFTFTIEDGIHTSTISTFTITITAVNDSPIAVTDTATSLAGYPTIINLLTNDSDPDNINLSITALTQPTHGTVIDNGDGTVTYTANNNYTGPDSFSYRAYDGEKSSAETAVNITVTAPKQVFLPMIIK